MNSGTLQMIQLACIVAIGVTSMNMRKPVAPERKAVVMIYRTSVFAVATLGLIITGYLQFKASGKAPSDNPKQEGK